MSEFNLKPHELRQGKRYLSNKGNEAHVNSIDTIMRTGTRRQFHIGTVTRFKEINEFKEVRIFKGNFSGQIKIGGSYESNHTEQDYKIENGKLFVRDLC